MLLGYVENDSKEELLFSIRFVGVFGSNGYCFKLSLYMPSEMAAAYLSCGWSELRGAIRVKYTPDFDDFYTLYSLFFKFTDNLIY